MSNSSRIHSLILIRFAQIGSSSPVKVLIGWAIYRVMPWVLPLVTVGLCGLPASGQIEKFEIRGKVFDQSGKPVPGADVILRNSKVQEIGSQTTDENGEFVISHKECRTCSLEVVPQSKSGFATAVIEGIPGDVTRSFVVPLKHGFVISGRVIHDRKGLKGLTLRAVADREKDNPHTVHDGGSTTTARNGSFSFILTPGRKHILISNERYGDLAPEERKDLTVTSDQDLGEIILPVRN